jgi:integrase/recombinase XerC
MKSTIKPAPASRRLNGSPQQRLTDALKRYLVERGYASHTVTGYVGHAAHFLHWAGVSRFDFCRIDEDSVTWFLERHLPHCNCGWSTRGDSRGGRAALCHLLVVLRTLGIIEPRRVITTPVDAELCQFDDYLESVRGLAPKTRRATLGVVREFLWKRFGDRPVIFSAITPDHVRSAFVRLTERCRAPASASAVVSALRSYFNYRATHGDTVYALSGVLSYPANWRLASLPKALADEEIERLLQSLNAPGPSMRRTAAIVHCAVDLGLRSGEIAALMLDDIDWDAGIVTLPKTKSRREQTLPLPESMGRAVAAYLQYERPKSRLRNVFVRRAAPCDQPVGPDLVRKTIHQAYECAGLPYTGSHLLRYTMARRLLAKGSSLKEVADVLRHHSLNTTLIYAKLDSRALRSVALPWPGR